MRAHPKVVDLWRALYFGGGQAAAEARQKLIGVPAVVALSPPLGGKEGEEKFLKSASSRKFACQNWLHLDYAPLAPRKMYQSSMHVFPEQCTELSI